MNERHSADSAFPVRTLETQSGSLAATISLRTRWSFTTSFSAHGVNICMHLRGENKIFEWHFKHLMLIDMEDISISMNSSLTARQTIHNHIHTLTLFLYNGAKRIYSDSWYTEDHWSLTLSSKINIQNAKYKKFFLPCVLVAASCSLQWTAGHRCRWSRWWRCSGSIRTFSGRRWRFGPPRPLWTPWRPTFSWRC